MAFADAIFDGRTELAGVTAARIDDLAKVSALLIEHISIPVAVVDLPAMLAAIEPDVLIDARMQKRGQPETQRGHAPLTTGLGPNFVAGETVDVAIETSWGVDLGRMVTKGATLPLHGEPHPLAGHGRDRYVYSPIKGTFHTRAAIGETVQAGMLIAYVGDTPLYAPLDGLIRGLTRDGVPVTPGVKVIEIDPRGEGAIVAGIGERPARIADGVLRAVTGV